MVTSKKRKKSAKRLPIDRPFDPAILRKARETAEKYQIVIWFEDGEYWGRCLELDCIGDGATPEKCIKATRQAATVVVAYTLEQGQNPPLPAREGVRTEQVNVRLSIDEKITIESAAKRMGFRGISDYIRSAAIAGFGK
ncbi:MAG: type II toxin-antitoxin system HicB family antitoxin [Tepidisphaerales bacterium]